MQPLALAQLSRQTTMMHKHEGVQIRRLHGCPPAAGRRQLDACAQVHWWLFLRDDYAQAHWWFFLRIESGTLFAAPEVAKDEEPDHRSASNSDAGDRALGNGLAIVAALMILLRMIGLTHVWRSACVCKSV